MFEIQKVRMEGGSNGKERRFVCMLTSFVCVLSTHVCNLLNLSDLQQLANMCFEQIDVLVKRHVKHKLQFQSRMQKIAKTVSNLLSGNKTRHHHLISDEK